MPGLITDRLRCFLGRCAGRPFEFGDFDCGLFLADWCVEQGAEDPARHLRGAYHSVKSGLAATDSRSTVVAFDKVFRAAGMRRTSAPRYGDIAMIRIGSGMPQGAIFANGYVMPAQGGGLSRVPPGSARRIVAWTW